MEEIFIDQLTYDLGYKIGYSKGVDDAIQDSIYKTDHSKTEFVYIYDDMCIKYTYFDYDIYEDGYAYGYHKAYYSTIHRHRNMFEELIKMHNKQIVFISIIRSFKDNPLFDVETLKKLFTYVS